MRKLVALKFAILLLFATVVPFSFGQTFPTVVASVKVTDRTTPITQTALFTPTTDGLFQINVYMVTTVPKTNGTKSSWCASVNWNDDAGNWVFVAAADTPAYQLSNSNVLARTNDWPLTFWARGGTPINYSVQSVNGNALGSTYEVFLTLQQLM